MSPKHGKLQQGSYPLGLILLSLCLRKLNQVKYLSQEHLCFDYCTFNSLLPLDVKAHPKAQGFLSLVPLLKIDDFYSMLNGSTVYSSLDHTAGYHQIALSSETQKKFAFVTPFGKFEFKKVPFGLA